MSDLNLSRDEIRTLRRMRRNSSVRSDEIHHFRYLYENDWIVPNYTDEHDPTGALIPDDTYRLGDKYWRYVESRRWFTWEYVVSHLVIPIAAAVIASYITAHVLSGI